MELSELYLKTAFCCMACDEDIAPKELELIKNYATNSEVFSKLDIESKLNEYVTEINQQGILFLNTFLKDISNFDLTEKQELTVLRIAIQMIEADDRIEYSEISFFKKIRFNLKISDANILENLPNIEEYLLPDIKQKENEFVLNTDFSTINLSI